MENSPSMTIRTIFLLLFVGIPALALTGFIIVSLWERQYLRSDLAPTVGQSPCEVISYFMAMKELAGKLGFEHGGDFHTAEGKSKVRGNDSLWVSGDRLILCEIVGAKAFGLPCRRARLQSKLKSGGIVVVTTDEPGAADLSGLLDREVLLNADLPELLARHRERLSKVDAADLALFDKERVLDEFESIEAARGERLVRKGFAKYADAGKTSIRFTVAGSLANIRHTFLGAGSETKKAVAQLDRQKILRPGDICYDMWAALERHKRRG